jgi:hypothetical protein
VAIVKAAERNRGPGRREKMLPKRSARLAETKQRRALPKTGVGAVCSQWVRCGKPNCRCVTGALHGPYHYLFWRERGRLRKRYVPAGQAEALRRACKKRRQAERKARALLRQSREAWRELLALLREVERDE